MQLQGVLVSIREISTFAAWLNYLTALDMCQEVRRQTEYFNEPGRFVTFLGCEWSAFTEDGGDRNVVYRNDEPRLRRSGRFFTEEDPDPEPDLVRAPEFHHALRNEEVLINMLSLIHI